MFPKEAECFRKKPNVSGKKKQNISERSRMFTNQSRIFPKEAETVDNQCQHMGNIG